MNKSKIIKLIAMTPTYRKDGLRVVAISHMNTYITGQQRMPGDSPTEEGLTTNQMLGIDPLTESQKKRFPVVINPLQYYKFIHNHKFNLDNAEDVQMLNFLMAVEKGVAPSKKDFRKGIHTHYLQDDILEAKQLTEDFDAKYEAMKHVKSASFDVVQDVAMYLNYSVKDLHINVRSISKDELYAALYKVCDSTPNVVIGCFTKDIKDEMLIVKMLEAKVIERKGNDFYEGSDFLGSSMNAVVEFMRKKENAGRLSKWQNFNSSMHKPVNSEKAEDYLNSLKEAIEAEDIDLAKSINATLDKMTLEQEQEDKFLRLKEQLVDLFNTLKLRNETEAAQKLTEARKKAEEEYLEMSLEDLKKRCGQMKKPRVEWEDLEKAALVDYMVQFVKVK